MQVYQQHTCVRVGKQYTLLPKTIKGTSVGKKVSQNPPLPKIIIDTIRVSPPPHPHTRNIPGKSGRMLLNVVLQWFDGPSSRCVYIGASVWSGCIGDIGDIPSHGGAHDSRSDLTGCMIQLILIWIVLMLGCCVGGTGVDGWGVTNWLVSSGAGAIAEGDRVIPSQLASCHSQGGRV